MKMSVKIARIPPIVPTIINKNRFWNLSEYLPNKGGKINIVNGKIERISTLMPHLRPSLINIMEYMLLKQD